PRLPRHRGRLGTHGPRHADLSRQHRADLALHAVVSLLPARRGRAAAPLLQAPGALPRLDPGVQAQRQPPQVGLVLAVLRCPDRLLRVPAGLRRVRRPALLL
ncbi:MAG: putative succinate dehydrogenase [membrane anchor subunit] (succinic dehydrogenase), partial [uncultured Phycisphaerae bacterium]